MVFAPPALQLRVRCAPPDHVESLGIGVPFSWQQIACNVTGSTVTCETKRATGATNRTLTGQVVFVQDDRRCGNTHLADPIKTAIEITANNVTLDLNGFTISGPTVCSGDPDWTCAPTGAGKGISSVRENVTVINGTVTGMGSTGIQVGNLARVEHVRAIGNGGYGISAGRGCILSGSTLSRNGVDGIVAYDGSIISGNAAYENLQVCIAAYGAIAVFGNTVRSNHDYGISISSTTGYGSNVLSGNGYGHVIGTGIQLGQNVCGEDNTCP